MRATQTQLATSFLGLTAASKPNSLGSAVCRGLTSAVQGRAGKGVNAPEHPQAQDHTLPPRVVCRAK